MRVCIGADHAGYELKDQLKSVLAELGVEVVDMGTDGPSSVDYPDFAASVARAVSCGEADRGILICGTGIGMAMVANKFPRVRAGVVGDLYTAKMSREHNDCNVLALGSRVVDHQSAPDIVKVFIETPFAGDRHSRRVDKVTAVERELAKGDPCAS